MAWPIEDVALHHDWARLWIATRPPLVAEITAASSDRLGLARGVEVWVSFKAVEVQLSVDENRDAEPAGTLGR